MKETQIFWPTVHLDQNWSLKHFNILLLSAFYWLCFHLVLLLILLTILRWKNVEKIEKYNIIKTICARFLDNSSQHLVKKKMPLCLYHREKKVLRSTQDDLNYSWQSFWAPSSGGRPHSCSGMFLLHFKELFLSLWKPGDLVCLLFWVAFNTFPPSSSLFQGWLCMRTQFST